MTKEQLKVYAKEMGLKVRESWLDDWRENAVIAACFFAAGWFISSLF